MCDLPWERTPTQATRTVSFGLARVLLAARAPAALMRKYLRFIGSSRIRSAIAYTIGKASIAANRCYFSVTFPDCPNPSSSQQPGARLHAGQLCERVAIPLKLAFILLASPRRAGVGLEIDDDPGAVFHECKIDDAFEQACVIQLQDDRILAVTASRGPGARQQSM